MDILKGLNLGHKSAYDLTNQFHHVFWFGDLNYRIDMQYEVSCNHLTVGSVARNTYNTSLYDISKLERFFKMLGNYASSEQYGLQDTGRQ